MDINSLWKWASETNEAMRENDESEILVDEMAMLLSDYGLDLIEVMFMEDGMVLKWI